MDQRQKLEEALREFAARPKEQPAGGREQVILTAAEAILRDRSALYATTGRNFSSIARIANEVRRNAGRQNLPLDGWDVGVIMLAVKMARLGSSPHHFDHYTDLAGYAGCLADIRPDAPVAKPNGYENATEPEDHPGGPLVVGSPPDGDEEEFPSKFEDDRPLENRSSGPIIDNRRAPGQ